MNNTNNTYAVGLEEQPVVDLSINLTDEIGVKARVTFDYEIFQGYQVTFWQDDDTDVIERVNSIFDLLFEEVLKTNKIIKNVGDVKSSSLLT